MGLDLQQQPHRRFNPLTREWILVSPHRTQRPWQGQVEAASTPVDVPYDPHCYMCPGNLRAGGERNPAYAGVFTFDNDFPALLPGVPQASFATGPLLQAQSESGICRVLCFSPRHDLTLARMQPAAIVSVVDTWAEQYQDLSQKPFINYVQIFENRGAMMGCSNPHPHCQVWASSSIPSYVATEQSSFADYRRSHPSCLLCDYLRLELELADRIVIENAAFVVLVPFWATWPFETLVLSRRHVADLGQLSSDERAALAGILKRLTTRCDNLFQAPFPYSMGFHQRPADGPHPEWHLHAHFFPPLLRSATVKKFMVGYEMLASPQRDITPESAAARLRAATETHNFET
ncbi:MAG TPA: UDP-glucose--hexose-1-phosphate uridylyltransferase [Terriglobales bacterium]|jgi:UDPglucose--hexose-1-phosphate uridylyltransferase